MEWQKIPHMIVLNMDRGVLTSIKPVAMLLLSGVDFENVTAFDTIISSDASVVTFYWLFFQLIEIKRTLENPS